MLLRVAKGGDMETKFKVGDKVRIRKDLKNADRTSVGMFKYAGKEATITKQMWGNFYRIDLDGGAWCWNTKDHLIQTDKLIFRDNATILFKDGQKYVAKCEKGDRYDREKGLLVCLAKAHGYTFKDLQKMLDNAEAQGNKQKQHIEAGKYKVGDFVKVVNSGHMFTTYEGWFDMHAPELKYKYLKTQENNQFDEEAIYKVVAKGKHEHFSWYGMVYAIKNNKGNIILIEENGIAKVGGKKIKLSEFWASKDKLAIYYKDDKEGEFLYNLMVDKGFCNKGTKHNEWTCGYECLLNDKNCKAVDINKISKVGAEQNRYTIYTLDEIDLNN